MTKINLIMDKQSYSLGEKVKGTFKLSHGEGLLGWLEHPIEAKIVLESTGEEKAKVLEKVLVSVPATTDVNQDGVINSDDATQQTNIVEHSESNVFLKRTIDLPVQSLGTPTSGGYVTIGIGTKEVPFEFVLDGTGQMLESYSGVNASVEYRLKGIVDKKPFFAIDAYEEVNFIVQNDQGTNQNASNISEKAKNEYLSMELTAEKDIFKIGESIAGKLTLDNPSRIDIRSVEVAIRGIEKATAEKLQVENITEHKVQIAGNWNSGDSRSFDLKIPSEAKRSYLGKLSKYSWEIAASVTMSSSLGSNLYLTHPIKII